jgi:hypothetical protein
MKNKNNGIIDNVLRAFGMFAIVFLITSSVSSQIGLVTFETPVTENFDTLANSGTTATTLPTGWAFAETGTNANTTYGIGNGSGTGGNTYSFGAVSAADRSFGLLQSTSLTPTAGASFVNNAKLPITLLAISYKGEQWRVGTLSRLDRIDFQYSTDATSLTTGTWIDVNSLDFVAPNTVGPIGALDGNLPANQTLVSGSIENLNLATGATLWIRWTDFGATGADDGLGVDDFSITPSDPLEITTANALPNAQVMAAYTNTLVSAGGVGPYTYAVTMGALPAGLTLNTDGTWAGMPNTGTAATYNFDVTVTDSNPFSFSKDQSSFVPNTKTESFSLIVTAPTAASATVGGRLISTFGRGLANASVSITNTATGELKRTRSNQRGYFNFLDMEVGNLYIIEVQSKRFVFNNYSFTLNEDLTDLVLTAQ